MDASRGDAPMNEIVAISRFPIGKLARVPLREVWKHEALDFTQWLQNNLDVLNSALDMNLSSAEREQAAGDFACDLVAEDGSGRTVIIENQLEKSNHDHLGKLITYLTGMDAKIAIWIVSDPRPEHVAAITWLNESSSADFYMVKVEAVRIGDSPAAALFTLIVGPSDEAKDVGHVKKEIAERHVLRRRWWTTLLERAAKASKLHANISPNIYSWLGASSGVRGLNLNIWSVWTTRLLSCTSIAETPRKTSEFSINFTATERRSKRHSAADWNGNDWMGSVLAESNTSIRVAVTVRPRSSGLPYRIQSLPRWVA
jgi:hypothetical protein